MSIATQNIHKNFINKLQEQKGKTSLRETKRLKDAFLHNANFDIFLFIILLDTYQRTLYIPTPKQGTHNYCP